MYTRIITVSHAAFKEILDKMLATGWWRAFDPGDGEGDERIDMQGVALAPETIVRMHEPLQEVIRQEWIVRSDGITSEIVTNSGEIICTGVCDSATDNKHHRIVAAHNESVAELPPEAMTNNIIHSARMRIPGA